METKTKMIFRCPYCFKEYDNFEECQMCIYNCAGVEGVIEEKMIFYICKYCSEEYKEQNLCEECEGQHEEDRDEFYSKTKLREAGEHPNQHKLFSK